MPFALLLAALASQMPLPCLSQTSLDSLNEFRPLTDDEVENVIKVIHHPGGTIPNPAPVVADAPALPAIPNPRIPVSPRTENNLQLMCYLLWHME